MLLNPHGCEDSDTCGQVDHKLGNREKVGGQYGLSSKNVARYIRIAGLIEPLISQVDTDEIAFLTAYHLSFIEDTAKQQQIADLMEADSYKVDMKKAELLRSYYETSKLTDTAIVQILSGEKTRKPKSDKSKSVKLKPAVLSKYFTKQQTAKEIEETIEKALTMYLKKSIAFIDVRNPNASIKYLGHQWHFAVIQKCAAISLGVGGSIQAGFAYQIP